MFLTRFLLKLSGGSGKRAQGLKWTGKNRIAHGVYPGTLERLKKRIEVEEKNLFYLRHPYLTVEQEDGHSKALQKRVLWENNNKRKQAAYKTRESIRMEDRLGHLNVTSCWEME